MIEKDYFCTVRLWDFARHGGADLIFKGGTCLAKVHVGFYRLSEDLAFAIPMPIDASRGERSRAAYAIKQAMAGVSQRLSGFSCAADLQGANDSAQYSGVVTYRSVLSNEPQAILIDVSVREPLLTPPATLSARTVPMDPISGQPAVPGLEVTCINALEAMAERFRATLSRRDVAIRDFYDPDHAARKPSLELGNVSFGDMVRRKPAIPDNPPVDVGSDRMAALRRQVDAKLKPVLRDKEFRDFDLDRAIALVEGLQHRPPAQLTGIPPPGPGVAPPLSARFGHASPSGQGRSLGRSTLVIDTGSIHGGRSPPRWSELPGLPQVACVVVDAPSDSRRPPPSRS